MKIKKPSKTKPSKTKPPKKPKAAIVKKAKLKPSKKSAKTKTQTIHETIETEHSLDKLASLFNLAANELKKVAEVKAADRQVKENPLNNLQYMWESWPSKNEKQPDKLVRPKIRSGNKIKVKPTSDRLLVDINDPVDVGCLRLEIDWAFEELMGDMSCDHCGKEE